MKIPTCSFTNSESNREHKERDGICKASSRINADRRGCTYIGCRMCGDKDNPIVWRCTDCYIKFQKKITKLNILEIPVLQVFLQTPFNKLSELSTIKNICNKFPSIYSTIKCPWKKMEKHV